MVMEEEWLRKEDIEKIFGFDGYKNICHLIDLGKYQKAEEEIKKIFKKHPDDSFGLFLQGNLRFKEGRIGSAVDVLEKAIKLHPNEAYLHALLGEILNDGLDKKRGLKELEKAVDLEPENADYKSLL